MPIGKMVLRQCAKLLPLMLILLLMACRHEQEDIHFKPIGYYSGDFDLKTGAPRQGLLMPETKARIILDSSYTKALSSIEQFEYIWVIYYFDKAKGWEAKVRPPESDHEYGLFATRSPRRPNAIGLSLVKLDSIRNNILYISGIDAFDKTPVLDLKPFLPSVDYAVSEKNMLAELYLGHHDEEFINDTLIQEFVLGFKQRLHNDSLLKNSSKKEN
ncbi:MAG: tRNA (N6-threonylcarbamoyladenosine(37)-N6)-methyltransferase TrmO [Bacteroidales bacterium]|nr:tRNA (N6-threonylcarbamoyladenosine(37)-N6)-methyltransferase TrmO [Bacteroidales bacterium]